ncbi:protein lap1 [Schistocerca americana]|uniref:protein lap1 n=1 Tax=Schistocerca americana TaxID=7009 RepID=UPI001F4F94DC|nr:protein lap1 [Schistocerca americana]XP_046985838.1 protein lap1 [Schistocerca americana]XP_046985839.1 protein lap1 [Schistocerca americana]
MPSWFNCCRQQEEEVRRLDFQHCVLNDVPAQVFAFERTLEELYLDSNRICDLPRPLFHCHGLKVLSLSDNEVQGLPPAIASLINLQYLDISRNALGDIPDNIKGCKHLKYVDVSVNPLEKLPEGFTQLIALEELYLNDTYLEYLPANFGRLMRLRILELRENNLNTLPKSIVRLRFLQRLDLGQNDFSDVPEVIGNLPNITELWVDNNRIRSIPKIIGNLKDLVHFDASGNNIKWIASEIGHCTKLVDLTLSSNEIKTVPETLGNLKALVTLKLDDNELVGLPNNMGKLSSLEELIVSQNDLTMLPASIGLLRKLHILNVDDNILQELPPEIGSCSSLSILSVCGNKLHHIPAEIGHLSKLCVLNLSKNRLKNLPVSILNLTQLNALWLSDNQSMPLPTLQQEMDRETNQMVCVNFMLPQSSQKYHISEMERVRIQEITKRPDTKTRRTKQHISFAADAVAEEPGRLMRAPTPYPKELRAMAKHARAIQQIQKKTEKEVEEDLPLLEEMVPKPVSDVVIKEAKVKKPAIPQFPSTVNSQNESKESMGNGRENENLDISDNRVEVPQDFKQGLVVNRNKIDDLDAASPVVAVGGGPVIREAKYVKKSTNSSAAEEMSMSSVVSCSPCEQGQPQPPPYYIAAAYSKQAAYFRQQENMQMQNKQKAQASPEDYQGMLPPTPVQNSNFQDEEKNRNSFLLVTDKEDIAPDKNFSGHLNDESGLIHTKLSALEGDVTNLGGSYDNCKERHEKFTEELPSLSPFISVKTEDSSKMGNFISGSILNPEQLNETVDSNATGFPADTDKNCVNQNTAFSHTDSLESDAEKDIMEPMAFTQEKAHITENVIVPTPQRPNSRLSNTPTCESSLCNPSVNSATLLQNITRGSTNTATVKSTKIPSLRLPVKQECNAVTRADKTTRTLGPPVTSGIPLPGFYSNIGSKRSSYSSQSSGSRPSSVAPANVVPDTSLAESVLNYANLPPVKLASSAVGNGFIKKDEDVSDNRSPVPMKATRTSQTDHNRKHSRIPVGMGSSAQKAPEVTAKPSKVWMFGLHKNATVFPVTITKSPGLGFSIMGGVKRADRHDNGIYITKVNPDGPASGLLFPEDKILEVDGIDFTKLEHDDAVRILKQTGNIVNMMVSRQQP